MYSKLPHRSYANRPLQLWKVSVLVFEIAFSLNFVITAVYWTMLHGAVKENFSDFWVYLNGLGHSWPLLSLLMELSLTLHRFRYQHVLLTFVVGVLYLMINCSVSLLD